MLNFVNVILIAVFRGKEKIIDSSNIKEYPLPTSPPLRKDFTAK